MKKRGFTFIELLIAISLFAVGMISVIQVFPLNRRYLAQSAATTQATFLAQEQIEIIRSLPYSSLTVGTYEAQHSLGSSASDPLDQFQRQTVVGYVDSTNNWASSASDTGLKKITVTVSWAERSVPRSYVLTTFAYDQ